RSRTCGNDRANSGKRLRETLMRTAMLSPRFQRDLGKHAELPAPHDAGDVERPAVDDQRVRLTDGAVVRQLRRVRADRLDHAAPHDLPASPGCVEKAAPGLDVRLRLRPAAVAVTDALHPDDFVFVGMELFG